MTATKTAPSRAPTLPTTMQAAIDRFGPPSVLKLRTVPVPKLGPSEVLIALHAAGVGIWDAKVRDGTWAEGDEPLPAGARHRWRRGRSRERSPRSAAAG